MTIGIDVLPEGLQDEPDSAALAARAAAEAAELQALYDASPDEIPPAATEITGGRALYSNVVPTVGHKALEFAAAASTANRAAGTHIELAMAPTPPRHAAWNVGRTAVPRIQGRPARPGRRF